MTTAIAPATAVTSTSTGYRLVQHADGTPATVNCNMPGAGWARGRPSRCVPATTDDVAAHRRR